MLLMPSVANWHTQLLTILVLILLQILKFLGFVSNKRMFLDKLIFVKVNENSKISHNVLLILSRFSRWNVLKK